MMYSRCAEPTSSTEQPERFIFAGSTSPYFVLWMQSAAAAPFISMS